MAETVAASPGPPAGGPQGRALLYLSVNDGTDTRINKEIATLSRVFAIDFVGISADGNQPFFSDRVRRVEIIEGGRRSPGALFRLWRRVFHLLRRNRYDSIHVINEKLLVLLLPLLAGRRVVLDLFDSDFLKSTWPRRLVLAGQRLTYARAARIIVTDEDRAGLMPGFAQPKLTVLPNYPRRYTGPIEPRDPAILRVLYAGTLLARRGTEFVEKLLEAAPDARVVMAGWVRDERTRELTKHPRVEWLGVINQEQAIRQATRCDFILCHYEPTNLNNVYASPNKIYDAIQAGAAVIINPEARVSNFVREHGLGVVLESFAPPDMAAVAQSLREFKAGYRPDPALRERYLWESVEGRLWQAHGAALPDAP
jgi:hypothetical protein